MELKKDNQLLEAVFYLFLPTEHKQTEVKKEIIASTTEGTGAGFGAGAGAGFGAGYGINIHSSVSATGVHQEINQSTTVRQSIVRSSVLPSIDGGTKVLKTIF